MVLLALDYFETGYYFVSCADVQVYGPHFEVFFLLAWLLEGFGESCFSKDCFRREMFCLTPSSSFVLSDGTQQSCFFPCLILVVLVFLLYNFCMEFLDALLIPVAMLDHLHLVVALGDAIVLDACIQIELLHEFLPNTDAIGC